MGGFRDQGVENGIGLGLCKVGGVGFRSNRAPSILCSAVRTISTAAHIFFFLCNIFSCINNSIIVFKSKEWMA